MVGSSDARVGGAITAVSHCAVLVRVQEPNGVIEGEVLKRRKAIPGNNPQTPLGRGTVRVGQIVAVGPVPVLHGGKPIVESSVVCT